MCGKTKLLGRRVEILIFGTMPIRLSEIPQSDLSELRAMERRDDPWINMWHQRSSQTPTSALQPQYPILGTSTSAPQPHTPPQHPNLIPQPQHPKCESMPLASFSHRYLQSCLRMPQKGQRSSRVLLQHATGTQNCV